MNWSQVAGRRPFIRKTPTELLFAHINEEPPKVRSVIEDCPAFLDQIVDRMLAKDPGSRPSARKVRDTLEAGLHETGLSPVARSSAASTTLATTSNRRPDPGVRRAAVAVMGLSAISALLLWQRFPRDPESAGKDEKRLALEVGPVPSASEDLSPDGTRDPPTGATAAKATGPVDAAPKPDSSAEEVAKKRRRARPKRLAAANGTKPKRFGHLTVNARPWVHVSIDGGEARETPVRSLVLTEGKHILVLSNEEVGFYREKRIQIRQAEPVHVFVDVYKNHVTVR